MSDDSEPGFDFYSLKTGGCQPNEDLIIRLTELWQNIFQTDYASFRSILTGSESRDNSNILYLAENKKEIIGTCHMTIPVRNPDLGGLGEVCTVNEFRGRGVARRLCEKALFDFLSAGGKALFLGTENPVAAGIYQRLGWIKIPGSNVMVYLSEKGTPEDFLSGYLKQDNFTKTVYGSPADRIPMIPLIIAPHKWQILDTNLNIFSVGNALQRSCMGLYPKYESLGSDGHGAWFAAHNGSEQTTGLASARIYEPERCRIDGFMHHQYISGWKDLISRAISWATEHKACTCSARLSPGDEEKLSLFENLSFRKTGKGAPFKLDNREVASINMELKI